MIVNKPIGAIKINGQCHKLTIGKQVPKIVLDYWKETEQLKKLQGIGAITDENKKEKVKDEPIRSDASGQSENPE